MCNSQEAWFSSRYNSPHRQWLPGYRVYSPYCCCNWEDKEPCPGRQDGFKEKTESAGRGCLWDTSVSGDGVWTLSGGPWHVGSEWLEKLSERQGSLCHSCPLWRGQSHPGTPLECTARGTVGDTAGLVEEIRWEEEENHIEWVPAMC